ncbi:gamma-glutamylcyclotransferase [Evansella sp. AB-rgal1]|uniref:gamma-glutamylcyclotransferase n=1 Tax=Evansella sp. AB-rgal1 TaxID=3242696 RepID=UPI00359CD600
MQLKYRVFVYGTLRKHEYNHSLLEDSKLLISQASINGTLYDTGMGYPMITDQEIGVTYGEVYEINEKVLEKLDELEGYDESRKENLYIRKKKEIYTDEGVLEAFVYVMNTSNQHMLKKRIASGDWKLYQWMSNRPDIFYYFAYGSCMDEERFITHDVVHYFKKVIGVGKLQKYELSFSLHRPDGGRADIKETDDSVEGIVYELPIAALDYLLDREGVLDDVYRPIFLDVEINNKVYKDIFSFTVVSKEEEIAPPDHYALEILRGSYGRVTGTYYTRLTNKMLDLGVDVGKLESTIRMT